MSIGVSFPFAVATGSLGYLEATDDVVEALKSNVRSLLLTNSGERVMHANFGCNLREFLFEQKTPSLRGRIAERIRSQLAEWIPFVSLQGLFVSFSGDEPGIPDPGFRIDMELTYGNIPVSLSQNFPG